MCCGSRRAAWRTSASAPASSYRRSATPSAAVSPAGSQPASGGPASSPGAFPTVPLRYHEAAEVQLHGPISGRAYRFSGAEPLQAVDARDAAIFIRYAAFKPA
jgi:hypothetical protein